MIADHLLACALRTSGSGSPTYVALIETDTTGFGTQIPFHSADGLTFARGDVSALTVAAADAASGFYTSGDAVFYISEPNNGTRYINASTDGKTWSEWGSISQPPVNPTQLSDGVVAFADGVTLYEHTASSNSVSVSQVSQPSTLPPRIRSDETQDPVWDTSFSDYSDGLALGAGQVYASFKLLRYIDGNENQTTETFAYDGAGWAWIGLSEGPTPDDPSDECVLRPLRQIDPVIGDPTIFLVSGDDRDVYNAGNGWKYTDTSEYSGSGSSYAGGVALVSCQKYVNGSLEDHIRRSTDGLNWTYYLASSYPTSWFALPVGTVANFFYARTGQNEVKRVEAVNTTPTAWSGDVVSCKNEAITKVNAITSI
jgi:hypothetical protein